MIQEIHFDNAPEWKLKKKCSLAINCDDPVTTSVDPCGDRSVAIFSIISANHFKGEKSKLSGINRTCGYFGWTLVDLLQSITLRSYFLNSSCSVLDTDSPNVPFHNVECTKEGRLFRVSYLAEHTHLFTAVIVTAARLTRWPQGCSRRRPQWSSVNSACFPYRHRFVSVQKSFRHTHTHTSIAKCSSNRIWLYFPPPNSEITGRATWGHVWATYSINRGSLLF